MQKYNIIYKYTIQTQILCIILINFVLLIAVNNIVGHIYYTVMKHNQELFKAIQQNDLDTLKKMEKKSFFCGKRIDKLNAKNQDGLSPLAYALDNDKDDIAIWLIERGAKVKTKIRGEHLLSCAIASNKIEIAGLLIDRGADMNVRRISDYSLQFEPVLVYAIRNKYYDMAKMMIVKGANVNVCDNEGYTPLLRAVINNNVEIATLLVYAGADINATNFIEPNTPFLFDGYSKKTPLMIAKMCNYQEIIDLLTSKGAK